MNTNKIKKALQACQGLLAENYAEYDGPPEKHPLNFIDDAIAELDRVHQDAEPVAWMRDDAPPQDAFIFHSPTEPPNPYFPTPLYTHPPQAQQPGKVLTDERIKEAKTNFKSIRLQAGDSDTAAHYMAAGYALGLQDARGYLSHAAGLTAEEAEQIVEECMADQRVGDYNYEKLDRDKLRTSLTAAINAKSSKA